MMSVCAADWAVWSAESPWPALPDDEVHVWRVALCDESGDIARGLGVLSPEERARAARFHQAADRERYVVAHLALRTVLGGYLGRAPGALRFVAAASGKPRLVKAAAAVDLRFSLAHSGQLALCAVARGREVGVDVERIGRSSDLIASVQQVLAPDEQRALERIAAPQREVAFYRLWTCKEAWLKATGEGLMRAPDSFSIGGAAEGVPRLLWVHGRPAEIDKWSLLTLDPQPGYAAALAVEGTGWRVRLIELSRLLS